MLVPWRRRKLIPLAGDEQISQRGELTKELCALMELDGYFLSDEATIYDTSMEMPEDIIRRCNEHYGVLLTEKELKLPLWKLLDLLKERRTK